MDIEVEAWLPLLEEAWGDTVPLSKGYYGEFIDRLNYLKCYYDSQGADTDD